MFLHFHGLTLETSQLSILDLLLHHRRRKARQEIDEAAKSWKSDGGVPGIPAG